MTELTESVYFLGIGGIGMSALARYYNHKGYRVSGYDKTETPLTKELIAEGIPVYYSQSAHRVIAPKSVVYTPAIKDGEEFEALALTQARVIKRSEALGEIAATKQLLAVAGTHGKTTTTSILSHILTHAGIDPTCFIGGVSTNLGTNFRYGNSGWMVAEADEFDRSFLQFRPAAAVLTSIDPDHLDVYGDADSVRQGYSDFLRRIQPGGLLMVHESIYEWAVLQLADTGVSIRSYGFGEGAHVRATVLMPSGLTNSFILHFAVGSVKVKLAAPGEHTVLNALAAAGIALYAGASPTQIESALNSYSGVKRRCELYLSSPELVYLDDYAHHPTELAALTQAVTAAYPDREYWLVFQPHLFTRTRDFFEGFVNELARADQVFVLPIYPAREKPIAGIDSESIVANLEGNVRLLLLADAAEALSAEVHAAMAQGRRIALVTAGAGDIDSICAPLAQLLSTHEKLAS
jgi:UDP-N-acetylmuramate--alanine ligase